MIERRPVTAERRRVTVARRRVTAARRQVTVAREPTIIERKPEISARKQVVGARERVEGARDETQGDGSFPLSDSRMAATGRDLRKAAESRCTPKSAVGAQNPTTLVVSNSHFRRLIWIKCK